MRGRNPSHAADSSTPVPSAFATDNPVGADGAEQPGNTQRRIAAQLERIAEVIVEPAQDGVHPLQARERLQIHRVVAHGEIGSLGQRHAQLSAQIGVLEVGLVEWPRSQDDGERVFTFVAVTQQLLAQLAEHPGDPLDPELADRLRQHLLDDLAVLQCVTGSGGCLRTVRQQPPVPIGRPGQIGGIDVQPVAAPRDDPVTGPEEVGMSEDQLGRHEPFGQQALRAVDIRQQRIQQRAPVAPSRLRLCATRRQATAAERGRVPRVCRRPGGRRRRCR